MLHKRGLLGAYLLITKRGVFSAAHTCTGHIYVENFRKMRGKSPGVNPENLSIYLYSRSGEMFERCGL